MKQMDDLEVTKKLVQSRIAIYKECREKIDELRMRLTIALKLQQEGKKVNTMPIIKEIKQLQLRIEALA